MIMVVGVKSSLPSATHKSGPSTRPCRLPSAKPSRPGVRDEPAVAMNAPARHTYYCRRMIELAESSPADPGARDALLWVLDAPWRGDMGAYHDEVSRAAALLVRYHGNDPEAVRIGLRLDNVLTPGRDARAVRVLRRGQRSRGERPGAVGPGTIPQSKERGGRPGPHCRGPAQAPTHAKAKSFTSSI